MLNKSYGYLLNVEPRDLVFVKFYNIDFDEFILILTNKNGRPLQKEDKFNL